MDPEKRADRLWDELDLTRRELRQRECELQGWRAGAEELGRELLRFRSGPLRLVSGFLLWLERRFPRVLPLLAAVPGQGIQTLAGTRALHQRLREEAAQCVASGLLDPVWYLVRNPDLVRAGVDPALHWVSEGWREKRDPGPDFNVTAYLEAHPDLAASGRNPLLHYLQRSDGSPAEG